MARNLSPAVGLELAQQDLSQVALPPAGLVIAVHPRATLFGPWYAILANVLANCLPGARCVVATFFEWEAQAVQDICKALGVPSEVRENPYYVGRPRTEEGTALRFAVVLDLAARARSAAGAAPGVSGGPAS